jgi:ubiquitin-protein ligase
MATENLAPQVISRLLGEIRDLVRNPPEGILYIESDNENNTVSEIHAQITGPGNTISLLYIIKLMNNRCFLKK